MGEDISSPFWVRVTAVRSVGTRNTLPVRRDIIYWLCSRKECVTLLFSNWWLPEELALLKSSPVAVEDDKKDTVNYWKSAPNQIITHVLFFRIISNLKHHHCMLLKWFTSLAMWTIVWHILAPKPIVLWKSEMWCATVWGFKVFSDQKRIYWDIV